MDIKREKLTSNIEFIPAEKSASRCPEYEKNLTVEEYEDGDSWCVNTKDLIAFTPDELRIIANHMEKVNHTPQRVPVKYIQAY